jgi:hypothetical protein
MAISTSPPEFLQIYNFTLSPTQILEGGCVSIDWSFGGRDIIMSRLFRDGDVILFDIPVSGSYSDCPSGTGIKEYRLVIDSSTEGSVASIRYVDVVGVDQPSNTITPSVSPPAIISFTVDPEKITLGQCVDLAWTFIGTNLINARLYRDSQIIAEHLQSTGFLDDCPVLPGKTEYRLVVDAENAGLIERTLFVTVQSTNTYLNGND